MACGALGRHWTVWKTAWQAESSGPGGSTVSEGQAMEFLPAVLEIQQTPPSPIRPSAPLDDLGRVYCGRVVGHVGVDRYCGHGARQDYSQWLLEDHPAVRSSGHCIDPGAGWTSREAGRCADRARFDPQSC